MKVISVVLLALMLAACNVENTMSSVAGEKVWVFAQFNVQEEADGNESYYYYGMISKSLYQNISSNDINAGFIGLENVMYWGNDDLVHSYAGSGNSGSIAFRIEDLHKLELITVAPVAGKGAEQFDEEVAEQPSPDNTSKDVAADKSAEESDVTTSDAATTPKNTATVSS